MGHTKYEVSGIGSSAVARAVRQGFTLPSAPDEVVELPADVSDLESRDLMSLFCLFTAWCDYASAQVGLAVIAQREAERHLATVEAEAWKSMPKMSVTASKSLVLLEPGVQKAEEELDEAYAYRRLVTDLAERYERDAAVLSRELTRRTSEPSVARTRKRWEP